MYHSKGLIKMITSTVTYIGESAINEKEPMLVLFNESATENLKQISIIQQVEPDITFNLTNGDRIDIDGTPYSIQYVGNLANSNLNHLGHTVLLFAEVPENDIIENALYLSPHSLPTIKNNSIITYHQKGGNN